MELSYKNVLKLGMVREGFELFWKLEPSKTMRYGVRALGLFWNIIAFQKTFRTRNRQESGVLGHQLFEKKWEKLVWWESVCDFLFGTGGKHNCIFDFGKWPRKFLLWNQAFDNPAPDSYAALFGKFLFAQRRQSNFS